MGKIQFERFSELGEDDRKQFVDFWKRNRHRNVDLKQQFPTLEAEANDVLETGKGRAMLGFL